MCLALFIICTYGLNLFPHSDYTRYLLMLMWLPFLAQLLPETLGIVERGLVALGILFLVTIFMFGHADSQNRLLKERRFGFRYGNMARPFDAFLRNSWSQKSLSSIFALLPLDKQRLAISAEDSLRVFKMEQQIDKILANFPSSKPLPKMALMVKDEEEKIMNSLGVRLEDKVEKLKVKEEKTWWENLKGKFD